MKSVLISTLLILQVLSQNEDEKIITYNCSKRSTQNSMYIDLRVGNEKIEIAVGSNIPFIVITGSECAQKEECGKSPGYDYTISPTVKKTFISNPYSRIIYNPFIPGVNDRIFEGEDVQDLVCPNSKSLRNFCVPLTFYKITKIVEGEKYSSNGRLGFEHNQTRDDSYVAILKNTNKINKKYVTVHHDTNGRYFLTFGSLKMTNKFSGFKY